MKLVCINVERSKHLDRVQAFLQAQQPDIFCLQELCARDVARYEHLTGNPGLYVPLARHPAEVEMEPMGVGIFSRHPLGNAQVHYYRGSPDTLPDIAFDPAIPQHVPLPHSFHQAVASVVLHGICFATTHLTVTLRGQATPEQLALAELIVTHARDLTARHGALVLCGDFNAPRGRATFDLLAQAMTDNIPATYTSSIDGGLHRAGNIPFMVDGMFSAGAVAVRDVALHTGVSDHCALVGTVTADR